MIIDTMYKRTVPMLPNDTNGVVTDELQNLWDQLERTHHSLEQVHTWISGVVRELVKESTVQKETNDVLHARIDELEKELYGEV